MAPPPPAGTPLCTRESLVRELTQLGVNSGEVLLVHTSMSALGFVNGGAETIIHALLDVIGPTGTIAVPTHSGDNSDPAQWKDPPVPQEWWQTIRDTMLAYDPRTTKSRHMGAVPELFRTWPGAVRSHHPQTSFTAIGPAAHIITSNHAIDCMLGEQRPLARLEELEAHVLMLGAGLDRCSAFHLGEYRNSSVRGPNSFAIKVNGHRTWVTVTDVVRNSDDFQRLGQDFKTKRHLEKGMVGAAQCCIFPLAEAANYATLWMRSTR